ncbi:ribosomal protein S19 [Candidatus Carsonella ruddii CS isolate Thao2000]|uniref:Small ribosomal subunit protein uS19 n=1 Tax=Candidatus Carsonella ruddii CS isolate Thao2000 TaxID=1202537 RepID=J7H0I5_CARRU|nr:30S ribosomal protein S19 [Candidatus Carsonella ruddii]AFP83825.1 ribosomal protein S19 [Candidatus Carsonella ruddii CS isolate Thao2000]
MSRSIKKGFFIDKKLYFKLNKNNFKTWSRNSTIIPKMIGLNIFVHNGKIFHKVYIMEEMIGYKLGEFSFTKIFKSHSKKIKIKKNVKK